MRIRRIDRAAAAALGMWAAALAGCGGEDAPPAPTAPEVEAYYQYAGDLRVEMDGRVAEITAVQPGDQLRRGGSLWAKVGPYVLLFSEPTRDLFLDHPGLAAVRVVTRTAGGREVARATLRRDALNGLTWRRALNISGHARRDGTSHVRRLEELIRWGEDHTTYEYDADFTGG